MNISGKRAAGVLSTVFASIIVSLSPPVHSEVLDESVAAMADAARNGDSEKFIEGLEKSAQRLQEIHEKFISETADTLGEIGDTFELAGKALAQEPLELDEFYQKIEDDTQRLDAIKPKVPVFGNPLAGIPEKDLLSLDPAVRGRALDKAREQGRDPRANYQRELDRFSTERENAIAMRNGASSAYDRGLKLTELLEKTNASPAAPFFNLYGNKLTYTLLDMVLYIQPAMGGRWTAADNLVKRYENSIAEMKRTLNRYDVFKDWANYYRLQDWVRENVKDPVSSGPIKPLPGLEGTRKRIEDAVSTGLESERRASPSPYEIKADALRDKLQIETTATQEQAAKLLREAAREASKEATLREFTALVNLVGAINGLNAETATPEQSAQPVPEQPSIIFIQRNYFQMNMMAPNNGATNKQPEVDLDPRP